MSEQEYLSLVREMSTTAGIQSTVNRRRGAEQRYYSHHKKRGVKLRGKYRP